MSAQGNRILLTPDGTTINDIVYNVRATGTIIPAIKIEPPMTIKYGDNEKEQWVFNLVPIEGDILAEYDKIGIGSKVDIYQEAVYSPVPPMDGKEVISTTILPKIVLELRADSPEINDNTKKIFLQLCPICGNNIRYINNLANCNNQYCPAQIHDRLVHFIRCVNIQLHGPFYHTFCVLIARGIIKNPVDIFTTSDQAVYSIADMKNDKYVHTYQHLVHEVIGQVSMYQLFRALNILPMVDEDSILHNFITYENERYQKEHKKMFNIEALISLVKQSIQICEIIYDTESDKDQFNTIWDQVSKLPDHIETELRRLYGPLSKYHIATLMAYVVNVNNLVTLIGLNELHLLNVDTQKKS